MSQSQSQVNKAEKDDALAARFGTRLVPTMVSSDFDNGWAPLKSEDVKSKVFSACTSALHYGQAVFEGMRAWRQTDGTLAVFRPLDHARRFNRSARRMEMPEIDEDLFVQACLKVAKIADEAGMVSKELGASIYLRPHLVGSDEALGVRPSAHVKFAVMACEIGSWRPESATYSLWISHDMPRAFKGGTGDVKCAGNYGGVLAAQKYAHSLGVKEVLYLDAETRSLVEEAGAMNVMAVTSDREIVTPSLSGTILPGITRRSVLELFTEAGFKTTERPLKIQEVLEGIKNGKIVELFACGTAVHVAPITSLLSTKNGESIEYAFENMDFPVTREIAKRLFDVQSGSADNHADWRGQVA